MAMNSLGEGGRGPADDIGSDDVVWPLAPVHSDVFLATRLARAYRDRALSADELRSVAMRLMLGGPPLGWLGAMLLMSSRGER
jgi:hypothetical protein